MSALFVIARNLPVDQPVLVDDRDDNPVEFDTAGTYRAAMKRNPADADADVLITFESGVDTPRLTCKSGVFEGVTRTFFHFEATQAQVEDLPAGVHVMDIVRTDTPLGLPLPIMVLIVPGVTPA